MIRFLTLAVVAALATASAASADAPTAVITGARAAEPISTVCLGGGRARFYVTFSDPDGISYAAVHLAADSIRPAVPERTKTWLWIPDYARDQRAYRWRYEDPSASRTSRTIPVVVDVMQGSRPLTVHLEAKDAGEGLLIEEVEILPSVCR
ncbi:hypothetical protein [Roseitranquillus sediminis]|uniref:hypothetical protein n=1 Tax=Roseitranquillus sediminis TaxID=2809051 RepID=UPI001D0C7FD2|nr:hypothetical protein [Roseitranquillus sediminis]MBM9595758.1 hypothetical protein [Roseitranquillus sediminis]